MNDIAMYGAIAGILGLAGFAAFMELRKLKFRKFNLNILHFQEAIKLFFKLKRSIS